jgi:hypothetical protein
MIRGTRNLQTPMPMQVKRTYEPTEALRPDEEVKMLQMIEVLNRYPDGMPIKSLFKTVGYKPSSSDNQGVLFKLEKYALIWEDDGNVGLA